MILFKGNLDMIMPTQSGSYSGGNRKTHEDPGQSLTVTAVAFLYHSFWRELAVGYVLWYTTVHSLSLSPDKSLGRTPH